MLLPKRSGEGWRMLSLLLACVLIAFIADVRAVSINIVIPERDEAWPWKPQLNLFVPEKFFTGETELYDADQWLVLSQVGVPLRITSDSPYNLMQVLELVSFMRADGKGQCPYYRTPYRMWYYWFHPHELALLYGEERWDALQRLQAPKAWSLVLGDRVGPAVREAERFIAHLKTADPPGQLIVNMRGMKMDMPELRVPLADFRVLVRVIGAGRAMEYRLPQLTVDGEAVGRRRHIHYFLQTKQKVDALIADFDAATVRAQSSLHASLVELQRAEQAAYDTHVHFKARYQRFLLERQRRRVVAGNQNGTERADFFTEGGRAGAGAGPSASVSSLNIHVVAPLMRTAEERRAVSCQKIYAAWDTLHRSGVRSEHDGRAVHLRRLHARHECPDVLPPLQCVLNDSPGASEEGNGATAELSPRARQVWAVSLAEMMAQREKSGRPPTLAQLYAVLFAVWRAEEEDEAALRRRHPSPNVTGAAEGRGNHLSAATAAAEVPSDDFRASAFVRFVERFVEGGGAVAMAGGRLPRFIRAELRYVVGILDLVTHQHLKNSSFLNADRATGQDLYRKADGVVRGVVHLYESLSAGSHHAAGALATLREHGIFTRQHPKAAMLLLLRSMQATPSHLLRELLLRAPSQPAVDSRAPSPSSKLRYRALGADNPGLSRLLRFEQFYAVDHTFRKVDDPFMTRAGVTTLIAVSGENTQSFDDAPELEDVYREAEVEREEGNYEGSITVRLHRRILKANMLLSGFKGSKHDPHEAQCELLVVLRQLGYFCDLNVPSLLSRERSTKRPPEYLTTIIGVPLLGSCPEHATQLYSVLRNTRHTLLACAGGKNAAERGHPRVPVPTSETLAEMLHQVLLSLSYVHLLHTHQYELSHMYAALSVELSLRLQQLLVKRLGRLRQVRHLFANVSSKSHNATARAPLSPYDALLTLAEGSDEVAWAAATLVEDVESDMEDRERATPTRAPPSLEERATLAVERCRSVANSPFVNTEALLLLALSRWATRGPLVGNVVNAGDVEKRLSEWTMEPFQLLSKLLGKTSAWKQRAELSEARKESDVGYELRELQRSQCSNMTDNSSSPHRCGPAHTSAPLDVHALFLVCLSAMKRWKRDFSSVHLLDSTSYSVHRTDPFVLASFLLHARDAATQALLISIPKLRDIAVAATPHFLGQVPHFLPLLDDTVESYAARLLRFAARHIHAFEPSVELLRSGSYGTGFTMDKTAPLSSTGLRRHSVVDDAPPRRFRPRTLRRVKQQTLEAADLQPLLYASDAHSYFNQSRWSFMGTALNAAYNALLYPFTSTTSESMLAEMEAHLQFVAPEKRKEALRPFLMDDRGGGKASMRGAKGPDSENPGNDATVASGASSARASPSPFFTFSVNTALNEGTTSVSSFVEAFAQHVGLREHFIACQLFSFTLESGMPEGFSLVFYEATDRGNPFLRDLADYLADAVFGRWTASVWTEHHLSAQWQREKGNLAIDGSVFTLDARSPFRYAPVEGRQELFARVSRWKAAKVVAAANLSGVAEARDQLLWCSGFLTRKAYCGSAQIYPFGYEGAVYPAADLECVADLNRLTASHGGPTGAKTKWSKAQWRQAQKHGTDLLRDLADRLAYDYDLIERPPAHRFALSESDFRRNTSGLVAVTEKMDRQHVHRKRFLGVSTQLVEPWNRRSREISAESLGYGEGTYYNSRLHRVSGYRWGSMLQAWWLWLCRFFS